jgi:hypothetical protein
MMTHHGWSRTAFGALAAVAFGFALAIPAGAAEITKDNVGEHIAAAKTAADHQAIASYFRSEAQEEEDRAKRHESMLASYEKTGGKPYLNMIEHCRGIIHKSRGLQQDYLEMAKLHEEMAKSAGK